MKIKNSEIRNLLETNQLAIVINPTKQFLEVEASVSKKMDGLNIVLPAHEINKTYKGMTFVYVTEAQEDEKEDEAPISVEVKEETPATEEVKAEEDVQPETAANEEVKIKAKRHRNPKTKWEVLGVGTYTNVNNAKWYAKQASKDGKKSEVRMIEDGKCYIEYENGKLVKDTWTTKRVK